jgi:hypothetical protein
LYIFGPARGFINSDTAAYSNIGRLIFSEKTLFIDSYYFANDDLLSFSPSVVTGFLAHFLGYGYVSHAISIVIFLVFLQFTLFRFASYHSKSKETGLLVSGTFIAFQSSGLNQLLLGNGVVYLLLISVVLWVSIWCKSLLVNKNSKKSKLISFQILLVSWFMIFSSPGRSLLLFLLPLTIGIFFTLSLNELNTQDFSIKRLIGFFRKNKHFLILLFCIFPAFFLRNLMMDSVLMQDAASQRGFVANNTVHSNFDNFIDGIVWISGIKPEFGILAVSLRSAVAFLSFLVFLMIIFVSKKTLKESFSKDAFTTIYFLSILTFSCFIYFLTSLNVDYFTVRYMYIPLLLLILFIVVRTLVAGSILMRRTLSLLLVSTALGVGVMNTQIDQERQVRTNNQIVSSLKSSTNGMFAATYWNAQKYEFISSGKLKAFPILLDPAVCVKPFSWLIDVGRNSSKSQSIPLLLDALEHATLIEQGCGEKLRFLNAVDNLSLYEYKGTW